jgi:putative ABC transport system permease protein
MLRELRAAVRSLWNSPGFTASCVTVLALGIGANAAIFSVIDAVVLHPLPYPDADRLVFVFETLPSMPEPIGPRMPVRDASFEHWREQNAVFSELAALRRMPLATGVDHVRRVSAAMVSANLFVMLGTHAYLGRLFRPEEEQRSEAVAVLSEQYFAQRFQGDASVLGKPILLGGVSYTVIGVLPRQFHLPASFKGQDQWKPDVWLPLSPAREMARGATYDNPLLVMGMLKAGVSLAQARADMAGLQERLHRSDDTRYPAPTASVFPVLEEDRSPTVQYALYALLGAAALLLLNACANLANLGLARAARRTKEIAVRRALGASRARIGARLFAESVAISLAGTVAGLFLARVIIYVVASLNPPGLQRPETVELSLVVFVFAAIAGTLTALLIGTAPALATSGADLNEALRTGDSGGATAMGKRSRQILIVAQVALALILVSGAGLLIRSFVKLVATGLGFETERLAVVDISPSTARYPDDASRARFYEALRERASTIPGVLDAAVTNNVPLHRLTFGGFSIVGRPEPPADQPKIADHSNGSPEFFRVIGLRMLAGRDFTSADVERDAGIGDGVVIVNRAFAETYLGPDPLRERIRRQGSERAYQVVGVVADYRAAGVTAGPRPTFFFPGMAAQQGMLLLRTRVAPESLADAIRSTVAAVDPDLSAVQVDTVVGYFDRFVLSEPRFFAALVSAFALLALILALLGVYSVVAQLVASQTREIGIRMAVGATPSQIARMVAGQSARPVLVGIALGLAGTLALTRVLEAAVFGITPQDPLTLSIAIGAIGLTAVLASWMPVVRATRIDCALALRGE